MPEDQGDFGGQSQVETGDEGRAVELPDGRRIPEETILEWERSGLRQADYTRKTQALAEERRRLEAERGSVKEPVQDPPARHVPEEGGSEGAAEGQLEELREAIRLAREEARFASLHPGADIDEVRNFARQRGIAGLDDAFRAMDYESAMQRAADEAVKRQRAPRPLVPPSAPSAGLGPSQPARRFRSQSEMIEAAASDLRAGRLKGR